MLTVIALLAAAPPEADVRRLLPADANAPGCALDVREEGKPVQTLATGTANLESGVPITANTVFEIGSVSKQFVGAGIALLVERGTLSLEDPIVRWLPELPPLYRDVSIDMLVHHTSGIRSWNNLAELTGRGEDATGYDNRWVLHAVARQGRLNHVPGTEYLYSNSNFVLAALIIERASGQRLNEFFAESFFKRLGMTHTRWRTDFREIVHGRAQAYAPDDRGGWRLDMPFNDVAGAGGLLSTVGDLQRWNATLANPSEADRRWVEVLERGGTLKDGTQLRYGAGLELDAVAGTPAFSHAGSTASYRAWLGRLPQYRLSVALLCNSGAVNTEELGPEIAALYVPRAADEPSSPTQRRAATMPEGLAGRWRNVANDMAVEATVDAAGLHLNGGTGFAADDSGKLVTVNGARSITIVQGTAGAPAKLIVTRLGNAPTILEPAPAWSPTQADLLSLVGSYASPEIDGVQRIELDSTQLVWRDPAGETHKLTPLYRNGFEARGTSWTLRFRSKGRACIALDFSITRARQIAFNRGGERCR